MTTRNDFIRQASLFTMNGLVDPRLISTETAKEAHANDVENNAMDTRQKAFSVGTIIEKVITMITRSGEVGIYGNKGNT